MWSALCAIFISVAVGGGDSIMSTTRQTRVLWSTRVSGTHRQGQAQAIARATNTCAVQYDTRWGFPRSGLRDTHALGITQPWAARLPDVYRDFTIFINLNTF